jgi:hypothetical protein
VALGTTLFSEAPVKTSCLAEEETTGFTVRKVTIESGVTIVFAGGMAPRAMIWSTAVSVTTIIGEGLWMTYATATVVLIMPTPTAKPS